MIENFVLVLDSFKGAENNDCQTPTTITTSLFASNSRVTSLKPLSHTGLFVFPHIAV